MSIFEFLDLFAKIIIVLCRKDPNKNRIDDFNRVSSDSNYPIVISKPMEIKDIEESAFY